MDLVPKEYRRKNEFAPQSDNKAKLGWSDLGLSKIADKGSSFFKLGTYILYGLLVLSVLLWGGFKFYQGSVNKKINELRDREAVIFTAEEREAVKEMVDFERRASLVQEFLKSHVYSSQAMELIASLTLPKVKWDSLVLSVSDRTVSLKGIAASYSVLAEQIYVLEANNSDVSVSGITLDRSGSVNFSVNFALDPKVVLKP